MVSVVRCLLLCVVARGLLRVATAAWFCLLSVADCCLLCLLVLFVVWGLLLFSAVVCGLRFAGCCAVFVVVC